MKKTPLILLLPLLAPFALFGSCALRTPSFDEDTWRSRVKSVNPALLYQPHFEGTRFFNPWMPGEEKGFFDLLRWKLTRSRQYTEEGKTYLPGLVNEAKERILAMPHGDFVTWVGHGTFLLRVNGVYWLVDPIFSERALLPKRNPPPESPSRISKKLPRP